MTRASVRFALALIGLALVLALAALPALAKGRPAAGWPDWSMFMHDPNHSGFNPLEKTLSPGNVAGLSVAWSTAVDTNVSSPAVSGGRVYIASLDGVVRALDASSGAVLWSTVVGTLSYSSPAVANGVVYIGSTDGSVSALRASNGRLLWQQDIGAVFTSPTVVNGVVYVGSDDGSVDALRASDGSPIWSYATGDDVDSSPAVVDGSVYVGSA